MAKIDYEWEELLKMSQPTVLSDEIMSDTLSKLPVKSIIRFKCVCKKWYELFADSSFIEAHLNQSIEGSNLVKECSYEPGCAKKVGYYLSHENFQDLQKLPLENEPSFCYEIVGSVNGLVCIQKINPSNFKSHALLWNPATRESRTVPECPGSTHLISTAIGFGFDPNINDYKVVMMTTFEESKRVDVYSLRNDHWRSFKVEYFFPFHNRGAHLNGKLHWLAEKPRSDRFLVSFDLTDEKIIKINVPENLNLVGFESPKSSAELLVLPVCNNEDETEIWFMKKYGDSESWSKLYNIPPHPIYGSILRNQCFFLENGKVIMQCSRNDRMISYDPKNQVYKILHIKVGANIIRYKESLVSVDGDGSFRNPNHSASIRETI